MFDRYANCLEILGFNDKCPLALETLEPTISCRRTVKPTEGSFRRQRLRDDTVFSRGKVDDPCALLELLLGCGPGK